MTLATTRRKVSTPKLRYLHHIMWSETKWWCCEQIGASNEQKEVEVELVELVNWWPATITALITILTSVPPAGLLTIANVHLVGHIIHSSLNQNRLHWQKPQWELEYTYVKTQGHFQALVPVTWKVRWGWKFDHYILFSVPKRKLKIRPVVCVIKFSFRGQNDIVC